MRDLKTRIQVVRSVNAERIAAEVIEIRQAEKETICEYIEEIAFELSMMASGSDQMFLGYLLNLVAAEAKSGKSQEQWHGSRA